MGKIKPYFYSVDLLRGLSALFVCLYHFINHTDGKGDLLESSSFIKENSYLLIDAVFIFFMISGFVIPLSMIRQDFKIRRFPMFLFRRWVRIEIPYLASIACILFIGFLWSTKGVEFVLDGEQLFHHVFYTASIFDQAWLNPIYWTLAIEFQFYIFIALVFPLVTSKTEWVRYGSLVVISSLSFFSEDTRFLVHYTPLFVIGILYLFYLSEKNNKTFHLTFMALLLVEIGFIFSITTSIYLLLAILIVEFVQLSAQNIFVRFGKMGYSFYLMHGIFGSTFIYFMRSYIENTFLLILSALIVAIGLSFLYFKIIEEPSQKLSKNINYSEK